MYVYAIYSGVAMFLWDIYSGIAMFLCDLYQRFCPWKISGGSQKKSCLYK